MTDDAGHCRLDVCSSPGQRGEERVSPWKSESAGKPDALQTFREFVALACFVAKRLECVRLAGAFAYPQSHQ